MSVDYTEALEKLTDHAAVVGTEEILLEEMYGRVLACDVAAEENVPAFARSPYDGYAFRAEDTSDATPENGKVLKVIDNIQAGQASGCRVTEGTAVRLMTGAPLPEGADAVCKYEDTDYTSDTVTVKSRFSHGDNVIMPGEDIRKGTVLAHSGTGADAGLMGTLASLGIGRIRVFRRPVAGIISTGNEIVEIQNGNGFRGEAPLPFGKIWNSNRYTIEAALKSIGFDTLYLGHAGDDIKEMAGQINKGFDKCDVIISTGGVSVGDYDLVPDAMKECGYDIIVRGVRMKPGMACAYGVKDNKLYLGLSGNPASSLTNLHCVCYPALKKITGLSEFRHEMIRMKLKNDVKKGSGAVRFIRGRLVMENGEAFLDAGNEQGNIVISSSIGCNAYGIIKGIDAPNKAGDTVDGFITTALW
ncbi:MAG: molybdopterin molybdotransferase MoeA, partial [Lachnospiraceae bacterium]|nr:molybdopterin molybdotransferase MoeA [Lachnospiraceae bacterium]